MKPLATAMIDRLQVSVHADRAALGRAAAADCAARLVRAVEERGECRMIFAAAPSQNELLAGLLAIPGLPWDRVVAFHMDEYAGLPLEAPQRFYNFLDAALFSRLPLRAAHGLCRGSLTAAEECERYAALLAEGPIDIVCLGVGENGHIAFNDPPADFADPLPVKEVILDEACRLQQVHDGAFPGLDAVPKRALTLTVPSLLRGASLFCSVPGPTKARAVARMLAGEIGPDCPATALRGHPDCRLYLDPDSAAAWLASRDAAAHRPLLLRCAEIALAAREAGNTPFGALLAGPGGEILLEQGNIELTERDCTGHAETALMREASRRWPKEFLSRCSLYSSVEPCAMCAGAVYWGGVGRVVYGLSEARLLELTGSDERNPTLDLPCREVFARGQRSVEVVGPFEGLDAELLAAHEGYWSK